MVKWQSRPVTPEAVGSSPIDPAKMKTRGSVSLPTPFFMPIKSISNLQPPPPERDRKGHFVPGGTAQPKEVPNSCVALFLLIASCTVDFPIPILYTTFQMEILAL